MSTPESNLRRHGLSAVFTAVVAASVNSVAALPAAAQCQGVKVFASDPAEDDNFGHCVAIDAAGQVALGGPRYHHGPAGLYTGAAYAFTREGSVWSSATEIIPDDSADHDGFGKSVSVSADGLTMLVGATLDDSDGLNQGAGYVYIWNGSTWVYQAQLFSPDSTYNGQYGCSAALSANGDLAVIGARLASAGKVYIFGRTRSTWSFIQQFSSSGGSGEMEFGRSVAISASGQILAVGVPFFDPDGVNNAGAVQVFTRSGDSWQHSQTLVPNDPTPNALFGHDVAISAAGTRLLIGARQDSQFGSISGSAYIFDHDGRTWSQTVKLTSPDASTGDSFGESVSLNGDIALIGAPGEDVLCPCVSDPHCGSGAAYLFRLERGQWTFIHKLFAADANDGASFGFDVALGGPHAMIGAEDDSEAASDAGTVYFFDVADLCPANDINHDGAVNGIDLGILLGSWSSPPGAPACGGTVSCPANLNDDCTVNGLDLAILLAAWG
jgi:hypothetical protein